MTSKEKSVIVECHLHSSDPDDDKRPDWVGQACESLVELIHNETSDDDTPSIVVHALDEGVINQFGVWTNSERVSGGLVLALKPQAVEGTERKQVTAFILSPRVSMSILDAMNKAQSTISALNADLVKETFDRPAAPSVGDLIAAMFADKH